MKKYWSSNKKGGYGITEVPRSKIKRTLFSRLISPEHINRIRDRPTREEYLASMLNRSSTPEEMYKEVGIAASAAADPIPTSSAGKEIKANGTDFKFEGEKQK
jgi:hypothetical protein